MKIGILTFYAAHNYGAVLQALASQYYLKSMGHKAYIIDYAQKNKYKTNFYLKELSFINNVKFFITSLITYPFLLRRYSIFNHFIRKNMNLFHGDWESTHNNFDCFYVGSDQVWNPLYWNKYHPRFFCQFPGAKGKICIAYAVSMKIDYIPQGMTTVLEKYLKAFSAISVREQSVKKLIEPLANTPVEIAIDPTLLLTKEEWFELLPPPPKAPIKPYIVVYKLQQSDLTEKISKAVAKMYNYKIIEIPAYVNFKDLKSFKTPTPIEFVHLIANAQFVVTTSFHGTVFSIIMQRPFYSIVINDKDERIRGLLTQCGLEQRIVKEIPDNINNKINWEEVQNKLKLSIKHSKDFLSKSLEFC